MTVRVGLAVTVLFVLGFGLAAGAGPSKCNHGHPCPTTTTTTTPPAYLFDDEFDGTTLDTAKWWVTPWCSSSTDDLEECYNAANAFVSGGSLHLRNSVGTMGRPYDSARVQTFREGGWPPPQVLASISPPVHLEARVLFGKVPGAWGSIWANGMFTSGYVEHDLQEFRASVPTIDACHVHSWGTILGQYEAGFSLNTGTDLSAGWHTYSEDYTVGTVTFRVDGTVCGTASTAAQPLGIRLSNVIGVPGTWGGQGGPPDPSVLPSDMLVDYVRAWTL